LRLSNGSVAELTVSHAGPAGSAEEAFRIVGDGGMIRYDRQQPAAEDAAPAEDFLTAVAKARSGEPWSVLSPASGSVETLRIIRAAYRSAELGGAEVAPLPGPFPAPLHHVAVQTSRYPEALRFYTEVLGMRVLSDRPFKRRTVAWLQAGNTRVELFSNRAGEELVPWSDRFAGPIHLAFEVENLRAFLATALERGAKMHPSHPEPFVPPVPGAKEIAYLLGPDGEEIEVRERE
jgi:glyoxylase I family protein